MRSVLDCGCVITGEGRSWCPSCLDPPSFQRLYTAAEVAEIVRADRLAAFKAGTRVGQELSIEWARRWPDIAATLRGKERG